jgi:hypothetical protein
MTYDEYKAQMTRNRERLDAVEQRLSFSPDDLAPFAALAEPLNVLVLAEDWCGDVIANLPIVGKLAEASGKLNVRIFLRDQHPDLMDLYLKHGQFRSIPVFAFFDKNWQEVGVFKERPDSVTELRAQRRADIYASEPSFGSPDAPVDALPEAVRTTLMAKIADMREQTIEFANGEVIRELKAIVANAA